jgi:heptosyltransferase-2
VKSILAIQLFALGDLVLTVPALDALRREWPDADLTLLVLPQLVPLARRFEAVDEVVALRSVRDLSGLRALRRRPFDLAVVFNPNLLGAWLAFLCGARTKLGYVGDAEGWRDQTLGRTGAALLDLPVEPVLRPCHEVERNLALTATVASCPESPRLALKLTTADLAFVRAFLPLLGISDSRPLLGVHPTAKWVSRRWAPERTAAAVDHAALRLDAHVVFLGAPGDGEMVERVRALMRTPSLSAVGSTDLPGLAALVAACDLLLCHDSGPMHLAAGFGVPMVALFGPGNVTKFRPFHEQHRVAWQPVPCNPCRIQFMGECPNNLCMKRLTVALVEACVDEVIDRWVATEPVPRRERLEQHLRTNGVRSLTECQGARPHGR